MLSFKVRLNVQLYDARTTCLRCLIMVQGAGANSPVLGFSGRPHTARIDRNVCALGAQHILICVGCLEAGNCVSLVL